MQIAKSTPQKKKFQPLICELSLISDAASLRPENISKVPVMMERVALSVKNLLRKMALPIPFMPNKLAKRCWKKLTLGLIKIPHHSNRQKIKSGRVTQSGVFRTLRFQAALRLSTNP